MKSRFFGRFALIFSVIVLVGLAAGDLCMASPGDNGFRGGPVLTDKPIVVGGGWYDFGFGAAGSFDNEGAFLFTSTGPVKLEVTDVACKGDLFKVYDNGVPIGDTSNVPAGGCPGPNDIVDPDVAYADPTYSHGVFSLAAGYHAITIQVTVSPFEGGGAFLRVDQAAAIPALSGWGLFTFFGLLVFCAVWFIHKRRTSFSN
jgi:hypothetical protein